MKSCENGCQRKKVIEKSKTSQLTSISNKKY